MDLDNYQSMLESKPEPVKQQSNSKSDNKKQEDNFFKDKNIFPKEIDTSLFKSNGKKYFTVFDNGLITDEYMKLLEATCTSLFKQGYIYRTEGNNKNPIDLAIRNIPNAKFELFKLWDKAKSDADDATIGSKGTTKLSYQVACAYHKGFLKITKDIVRCYFARMVQMLLGENLDTPVDLVLIYTNCGNNTLNKSFDIKTSRSVWFILKLANAANISAFNLRNKNYLQDIKSFLSATNNGVVENIEAKQPSPVQEVTLSTSTPEPKPQETNEFSNKVPVEVDDIWEA